MRSTLFSRDPFKLSFLVDSDTTVYDDNAKYSYMHQYKMFYISYNNY